MTNRMKHAGIVAAGVVSALALVGLAHQPGQRGAQQDQQQKAAPLGALVSLHGPTSNFTEERFVRVMDAETFRVMWAMHMGEDPKDNFRESRSYPTIDFDRCMVIAYFRGPTVNSDGEVVESVEQTADGLRVRFDSLTFQTASFDGRDEGVKCAPFGIWILPRDGGPVIVEENVQGLIGEPPKWKERIRFERFDGEGPTRGGVVRPG